MKNQQVNHQEQQRILFQHGISETKPSSSSLSTSKASFSSRPHLQSLQIFPPQISPPILSPASNPSPSTGYFQHGSILNVSAYTKAPSPTPSGNSAISMNSVYTTQDVQTPQSPGPCSSQVTFIGIIPTYHGRQGGYAGFVNSEGTCGSQLENKVNVPCSPSPTINGSFDGALASFDIQRRVSVSSIASSHPSFASDLETKDPQESTVKRETIIFANSSQHHYARQRQLQDQERMRTILPQSRVGQSSLSNGQEDQRRMPPWAETKTRAGKNRKRLPLACLPCRQKKVKCSGSQPACNQCDKMRLKCVYKVNPQRPVSQRDNCMPDPTDTNVPIAQYKYNSGYANDESHVGMSRNTSIEYSAPPLDQANNRLRNGSVTEGSVCQSRKRRSDAAFGPNFDLTALEDQQTMRPIKAPQMRDECLSTEGFEYLPTKQVQQHLAQVYFTWVYGQSYPLLHKPTFMKDLAQDKISPVLMLTVCAISARFSDHTQFQSHPAFLRGELWASQARSISLGQYDKPNITIIIVYLLLALHEFGTCQGDRSWMFGGMAQRMALMMQLHNDQHATQLSCQERETRRRVMWSCYLMDKYISSGSDRPMTFPKDCIIAPLPVKEELYNTSDMDFNGDTSHLKDTTQKLVEDIDIGTMAFIIRLVAIWSRLVKYFNMGGRLQDKLPMWDKNSQFHEIELSLESFQFPGHLKWTDANLDAHKARQEHSHFIYMHMIYNHLWAFLYRFTIPQSGIALPVDMPRKFFAVSQQIAIDAANKVANLVRSAMSAHVTSPFSGYVTFYSSTILIQGIFAKTPALAEAAKINLKSNLEFLEHMSNWWGMFQHVKDDLKMMYCRAEECSKGAAKKDPKLKAGCGIFQFGDWFDLYPQGIETSLNTHSDINKCSELKVEEGFEPTPSPSVSSKTLSNASPTIFSASSEVMFGGNVSTTQMHARKIDDNPSLGMNTIIQPCAAIQAHAGSSENGCQTNTLREVGDSSTIIGPNISQLELVNSILTQTTASAPVINNVGGSCNSYRSVALDRWFMPWTNQPPASIDIGGVDRSITTGSWSQYMCS